MNMPDDQPQPKATMHDLWTPDEQAPPELRDLGDTLIEQGAVRPSSRSC